MNYSKIISLENYNNTTIKEGIAFLRALIDKDAPSALAQCLALATREKENEDIKLKAEIFHVVGRCFDELKQYDSALEWYGQALALRALCQDKLGQAQTLNNIGLDYYDIGKFKDSIVYFKQAIDLKLELKEYKSLTSTYQNLGSSYEKISEYKRAMEVYYKGLKISEKFGDEARSSELYQNMGNAHYARGNYRQAIDLFQKARGIQSISENTSKLMLLDNNMGNALMQLRQFNKALFYFEESLLMAKSLKNVSMTLAAQCNIGALLKMMDRFDESLRASKKGLELSITQSDYINQCNALTNIGDVYFLRKDYPNALTYLKKAQEACRKTGNKSDEAEVNLLLSKVYEAIQNHTQALFYYKKYDKVKSQVASTEIANRINQLQTQYEVGKKEEELTKTKALQVESELKALRAQMDPHFIFNALGSMRKELLEGNIEKADTYIVRFSRLLRLILDTTRTPQVKLSDNIELLHLYIQIEQSRHPDSFSYSIKLTPGIKPANIVIPGMVLQPLVENAIVHGLFNKQNGKGKLQIIFSKAASSLKIKVSDNGVGRSKSNDNKATGHQSHATSIIRETLALAWKDKMKDSYLKIKDKTDSSGQPSGTEVTILLPYIHS